MRSLSGHVLFEVQLDNKHCVGGLRCQGLLETEDAAYSSGGHSQGVPCSYEPGKDRRWLSYMSRYTGAPRIQTHGPHQGYKH